MTWVLASQTICGDARAPRIRPETIRAMTDADHGSAAVDERSKSAHSNRPGGRLARELASREFFFGGLHAHWDASLPDTAHMAEWTAPQKSWTPSGIDSSSDLWDNLGVANAICRPRIGRARVHARAAKELRDRKPCLIVVLF